MNLPKHTLFTGTAVECAQHSLHFFMQSSIFSAYGVVKQSLPVKRITGTSVGNAVNERFDINGSICGGGGGDGVSAIVNDSGSLNQSSDSVSTFLSIHFPDGYCPEKETEGPVSSYRLINEAQEAQEAQANSIAMYDYYTHLGATCFNDNENEKHRFNLVYFDALISINIIYLLLILSTF